MTTPIAAYLTFDGNCREAMTFYQQCLGGELQVMSFRDIPADEFQPPEEALDRVMHACLTGTTFSLMASDTMPGTAGFTIGNHVSLVLTCQNPAEVDARVAALSAGGTVSMPPADVFWGSYFAMLTDQFGMSWMVSYDHPVAEPTVAATTAQPA
jgi:PhnB protein